MKSTVKLFLLGSLLLASGWIKAQSDVLLTVDNQKITVNDFLSVYQKNNPKQPDEYTQNDVEEYLDLYVNFRLKVREAEKQGIDTTKKFTNELAGYRKQLAKSYFTDKSVVEKLVKEAYERKKFDIRASHILITIDPDALPSDTLEAYNKAMSARKRVVEGKEDFATVAKEMSQDPSAQKNGGDLEYFTVFNMVYPFETAAFNTAVGEVSMPVRSRFGYHVIKVVDKRDALGEVQAAHIMTRTSPKSTPEELKKAEEKIREVYAQFQKGDDTFDMLAKKHSEDPSSAKKGGEMPYFKARTYPMIFENQVAKLRVNEVSEPFKTDYGWHIVKKIGERPLPTFEEAQTDIKRKVNRDVRSELSEKAVINRIKKEYGFKEYRKNLKAYHSLIDSSYFRKEWDASKAAALKKKLFVLEKKKYTQKDFTKYLEANQSRRKAIPAEVLVNNVFDKWVNEICTEHEEAHLEEKYSEFRDLMKEYRDGILLFDVMEKMVWNKASQDTVGLRAYYEANKNNFMWQDRIEASVFKCAEKEMADLAKKMLEEGKMEADVKKAIDDKSKLGVSIDNGKYEKNDKPVLAQIKWQKGVSEVVATTDGFYVVRIDDVIPATYKKLDEARGLITAEYQNYLEKTWLEDLKAKYKVDVNKDVLAKIYN